MSIRLTEDIVTLEVFGKAFGIGSQAISNLRKRGMPILRIGGRTRISVSKALAWIEENCSISAGGAGKDPLQGRIRNLGRDRSQDARKRR